MIRCSSIDVVMTCGDKIGKTAEKAMMEMVREE